MDALGALVLGVSGDSVAGQALFKKAEKLNFPLLSDYDGKIAKAFGVPLRAGGTIKKLVLGKEESLTRGVSAGRWTIVIGKDGKISLINTARRNPGDDWKSVVAHLKKAK